MGSLSLLQGIFPTQGSNSGLPHCRQILYQLSHKGRPKTLEWVVYPFSRGASWLRNQSGVSCITGRFFTNWAIREAHFPHNSASGETPSEGSSTSVCWSLHMSDQRIKAKPLFSQLTTQPGTLAFKRNNKRTHTKGSTCLPQDSSHCPERCQLLDSQDPSSPPTSWASICVLQRQQKPWRHAGRTVCAAGEENRSRTEL